MSIELTTADQATKDAISATLAPPILTTLPALDSSKAGQTFYLNGTLWTYARAGQFGTLPVGTPWPVKGYKEDCFEVSSLASTPFSFNVISKETDVDYDDIAASRPDVGWYDLSPFGIAPGSKSSISRIVSFGHVYDGPNGTFLPSSVGTPTNAPTAIRIILFDLGEGEDSNAVTVNAKYYPPTT